MLKQLHGRLHELLISITGLPFRQREYDIAKWFSESDSGQMPIDVQIREYFGFTRNFFFLTGLFIFLDKNSHGKNSGDATVYT